MVWATESAYQAAKTAYTLYGWYLQEVAAEFGWENAIALQGRTGIRMADMLAGALRSACGERKLQPAAISDCIHSLFKKLAADYDLQTGTNRVVGRYGRCPIYDGLAASGIEHAVIQKVCEALHTDECRRLEHVFPEIKLRARFRERADGECIEEFVLTN